jgi:hypothetical protein
MNPRTRGLRQSRRAMAPGIDHLESRQLLSTIHEPVPGPALAHHHQDLRPHHAAVVERAQSGHHAEAVPAATPATVTGLQVVAQPSNDAFDGTTAIADNDIWAVGGTTSGTVEQPVAVQFNGTSWNAVPVPTVSTGAFFEGVAGTASNDVWAVGQQNTTSSTPNPLIEHWNGTSWSVVSNPTVPNGSFLKSVTAVSSTNVWTVGENGNLKGDLIEHWNGTIWSLVSSPAFNGANDDLFGISADSSNDVWAVGRDTSNGDLVELNFNRTSWSRMTTPIIRGFASLDAVTALSPTNVWASGRIKATESGIPVALIEHWNGTSWSVITSPNPDPGASSVLGGIAAVSANDIWAVGVFIDNWNGTSWSIVTNPIPDSGLLEGVTAFSDGTAVAVGTGGNSSDETVGLILQN